MNKFLLSALLASTVMFSGAVKAAEKETAVPTADKQIEMVKHHEGFDKDFHEKMAKKMAQDLGLTQETIGESLERIYQEILSGKLKNNHDKIIAFATENFLSE